MTHEWCSGRIELTLTNEQVQACSHPGDCDADVLALSVDPGIRAQLEKIDPVKLSTELRDYGAWDDKERSDHEANLRRILWIAACDINERQT